MKNSISNTGSLKKENFQLKFVATKLRIRKTYAVSAKTFKRFSFRSKFDVFESSKPKKKLKKKFNKSFGYFIL